MPELPEIQAHAERLTDAFRGRVITGFTPLSFTALKTYEPEPEMAFGHPLRQVARRGKYLLMEFHSDGHEKVTFAIHLMQGGRLRPDEKRSPKPRDGIARWLFDAAPALLLTEAGKEKRAGVWVLAGDVQTQPPVQELGPDADLVDEAALMAILHDRSARLHGVLRDQRAIAGIGRRLANEICHRARLSPFANASKLTPDDVARLVTAMGACISESLAYERERTDMSSSKERPGHVHHHAGDPCPVCGDEIRSVEYRAYTVTYCATCQTGGKVLADNTTSKFLK